MKQKRISRNEKRIAILKKLFPEGISKVKIWNGFISILGEEQDEHLSVEMLESVVEPRLKLRQRIERHFRSREDKLYIISLCDMDLLHSITQMTWALYRSHKTYSRDAIVLHGLTPNEIILDWAAQSVITMLLRYIKASISSPRLSHLTE